MNEGRFKPCAPTFPANIPAMQIREAQPEDNATLAKLISESNNDVATRFGLNADNCPKHPSFCTAAWVSADFARGERYFVAEVEGEPVACVAYEVPNPSVAYLNRLSVLPGGLVQHVLALARAGGIATVSIGVIGEHAELQRWYAKQGFVAGEQKHFAHLPFSVRYMSFATAA